MTSFTRWMRFNLIGVAGFAVQLSTLAALTWLTTLPLAVCVALAVLTAVAHNFLWHERYTWPPPPPASSAANVSGARSPRTRATRWLAFTLSNGAISLSSNIFATTALVFLFPRLPLLLANAVAVALTSLLNFLVADRAIFRSPA